MNQSQSAICTPNFSPGSADEHVADNKYRGQQRAHFHDEHHRILRQRERIQLHERGPDGAIDDLGIEQRARPGQLLGKKRRGIFVQAACSAWLAGW